MSKKQYRKAYLHSLVSGLSLSGAIFDIGKEEKEKINSIVEKAAKLGVVQWDNRDIILLSSIVASIGEAEGDRYYTPQALNLEKDSVFATQVKSDVSVKKALKIAKEVFKEKAKLDHYTLYHLANKHLSRLGFGKNGKHTDISLFDRNRIQAAICSCLKYNEKGKAKAKDFLLLKGDLSGIQDFLYGNIKADEVGNTRNLAKRLRGRSFFIALLTDTIAEMIVEQLGLEQANIIFSGGGQFTILVPKMTELDGSISSLLEKVNKILWEVSDTTLSLLVATANGGKNLFKEAGSSILAVNQKLSNEKLKKYEAYLSTMLEKQPAINYFKDDEWLGNTAPYIEYLIEVTTGGDQLEVFLEQEENISLKEMRVVRSLASLGKHFFMLKGEKVKEEVKRIGQFLEVLQSEKELKDSITRIKIIRLNNTDFLEHQSKWKKYKLPISYGFRFVGKEAPIDSEAIAHIRKKVKPIINEDGKEEEEGNKLLSFEELAYLAHDNKDKPLSYPRIAAMRLDVDDLGAIFGYGLQPNSLTRLAALSREFHFFFSGYFNRLAKQYQVYITYSGGDDAFIVGSWYNVLHFAKHLREDFQKFTGYNKEVTFSAGIFMCDGHFPIVKMAEEAGKLEDLAKAHCQEGETPSDKNAIAVFNTSMKWSRFNKMMTFSEELEKMIEPKEDKKIKGKSQTAYISRSLIHRLLTLIQSSRNNKGSIEFYKNVAHLHALFARHEFNNKRIKRDQKKLAEGDETKALGGYFIPEILKDFANQKTFEDYLLPLQYILYKSREIR